MESIETKPFGKWRERLWPIHRYELKKILPLLSMKFFISLIYAILTCMKDTLIVTAKGSGAEAIPVLKGWVVLPAAILVTLIYTKLTNIFKRTTLFYGMIGSYLILLFLFGFVLYPNSDILSPHSSADWLLHKMGSQFSHWVAIYRHWIPSLFFVSAELWASLVIFLLFWGLTNQITSIDEAKRTYTLFIAAGDVATIIAGPIVLYYSKKFAHLDFIFTMQWMVTYVIIFGLAIMGLHYYIQRLLIKDPRFKLKEVVKRVGEKTKLSLSQSLKHIASSKYLLCIAVMVIGYGLCINLIEVTWKAHLKLLFPSPADYQSYMGAVTTWVGVVAFITVLFLGGGIMRFFGWHFTALITPVVVGVTGLVFLSLVLAHQYLGFNHTFLKIAPLSLIVAVGAFQNIASKVVKYSFFDPSKEMAYIPLDQESKVKGKAAIDVVGSRFGKSGASWIQVGLIDLIGTGSVLSITNYLTPVIALATISWIIAVRYVSKQFTKKLEIEA